MDDSGNINTTNVTNTARTNANPANSLPVVTDLLPLPNSSFNMSTLITLSATVTDDGEISLVYANVTYPNSTSLIVSLATGGNGTYNALFLI